MPGKSILSETTEASFAAVLKDKHGVVSMSSQAGPAVLIRCRGRITDSAQLALLVVDGLIIKDSKNIDTDLIVDITVLKPVDAVALFGMKGKNGAIIISTSKATFNKTKTLDTVRIGNGPVCILRKNISSSFIKKEDTVRLAQLIQGKAIEPHATLKIYPDPVVKGAAFKIAYSVQQPGDHVIQVINASGQIVLQQKTVTTAKQYTAALQTGTNWSSGIYYIRLFDGNNKMISTNNFLIQ
ncbi:T9SS type A sorting domain-containing protein [Ferruginibacter sp.]